MTDAEILGPNDPGPRNAKDANYTSSNGGDTGGTGGNGAGASAKPFPWERLAFTVLFAFVAWFAFWLALIMSLISGVLMLFGQSSQENFSGYARKVSDYLSSALAYISGATDQKPFPFN